MSKPKLHPIVVTLLADVAAYREQTSIDRTKFGLEAAGDGHFLRRMESGQIPRIPTIDRVYAYMDRNRERKAK